MSLFEQVIDLSAVLLSIIGGCFALLQWRKSEDWKRKEFVQHHFEKLQLDVAFRLATGMMDWDRKFRLDEFSGEKDQYFQSSSKNLKSALKRHGSPDLGFSTEEAAVRDIFDVFLTRLDMVVDMIQSGLISYSDVKPYLQYWIGYLLKKNKVTAGRNDVADLIGSFAEAYGYKCIEKLAHYDSKQLSGSATIVGKTQ